MKSKKKIVLAYSGGLDTSIILKWLQENYQAEVICYTADVGQEIDRKKIFRNAKKFGVKNIIIQDLKDEFVKNYVYPMIRGHAIYEGVYLLGTSIARPLIAKDQIRVAKKFKAFAVSHGATGKGNDQVRFELGYHYFGPKIKVIAPWRIWKLKSRTDLINYAHGHPQGRLRWLHPCVPRSHRSGRCEVHGTPGEDQQVRQGSQPFLPQDRRRLSHPLPANQAHGHRADGHLP